MTKEITREELYELVWKAPMLRVAEQFDVSSSYMARVCEQLHVPRPDRGYWAKLEFGKASPQPALPPAPPGMPHTWMPGAGVRAPIQGLQGASLRDSLAPHAGVHPLLAGVREHFLKGRTSRECEYLKPAKWNLPDLTVTEGGLDAALALANALYQQLEHAGGRVLLSAGGNGFRRVDVGELEDGSHLNYNNLWAPGRCTLVYFDDTPIGLAIGEIAEVVEARYVNGTFYREGSPEAEKAKRSPYVHSWTAKQAFATRRLFVLAYCPNDFASWQYRWIEKTPGELVDRVKTISSVLRRVTGEIEALVAEGKEKARIEWERREAQWREYEQRQEREQREKAREESRAQLLQIFARWNEAAQVREFLEEAQAAMSELNEQDRPEYERRLAEARMILPEIELARALLEWKPPSLI